MHYKYILISYILSVRLIQLTGCRYISEDHKQGGSRMRQCHNCRRQIDDDEALYCSKCGTRLVDIQTATGGTAPKRNIRKVLFVALGINLVIVGGFLFMNKGCSRVTGTFVATGEPLGNFTFVPKQCRSGQHMNFFGSVLLGEGQQDGALVAVIDPVKGKTIKIEVPGSCEPPDYEKCKEVIIDPKYCSRYDVTVNKTGIMVNNIIMVDGKVNVDCVFPGGGTARGNITFEKCN